MTSSLAAATNRSQPVFNDNNTSTLNDNSKKGYFQSSISIRDMVEMESCLLSDEYPSDYEPEPWEYIEEEEETDEEHTSFVGAVKNTFAILRRQWDEQKRIAKKEWEAGGNAGIKAAFDHVNKKLGLRTNNGQPNESNIEFESLGDMAVEPTRWLVPGRIPQGKLLLVAGDGGRGKSTLMRHLVAKVTAGECAFGLKYKPQGPGRAILLASEDGITDVVLPSLIVEGANIDLVQVIKCIKVTVNGQATKVHFTSQHLGLLKEELAKKKDVRLVVVDPAISLVGRSGLNDSKGAEIRAVLDPLAELAEELGITVVVVAHLNKSSGAKAVHRVSGSQQYLNAVRLAYIVEENPDNPKQRLLLPVKKNLLGVEEEALGFELEAILEFETEGLHTHKAFRKLNAEDFAKTTEKLGRLYFVGNVKVTADEAVNSGGQHSRSGASNDCAAWLRERLGTEFCWLDKCIQEEAEEAGFSFKQYTRAKSKLRPELKSTPRGAGKSWVIGFGDLKTMPLSE